jgi:hypothetical protein
MGWARICNVAETSPITAAAMTGPTSPVRLALAAATTASFFLATASAA